MPDIQSSPANETPLLSGEAESFRLLLESCDEGMGVILADGELAYANDKFLTLMGCPPDQIPERLERFLNGIQPVATIEAPPGSQKHPFEIRKTCSSWLGNKAVFVYTRESTTTTEVYESAVKDAKSKAIELMAGGIAHDYNNFSAIILGNLSLAKPCIPKDCDLADILKDVEAGARRAKEFTNTVEMLSRAPIQYLGNAAPGELLAEAAAAAFEGSSVAFELTCESEGLTARANEELLRKAFTNLLTLCRQAMGGSGILKASITKLPEEEAKTIGVKNAVEIRLSHQGAGFSSEDAKKIFDPYFIPKSKEFPRGGKLELAFAAAVIKKHGGSIHAISAVGEPTTFIIRLPA